MAHIFFFKRVNGDRLSLTLFEREREARQGRARQGRAMTHFDRSDNRSVGALIFPLLYKVEYGINLPFPVRGDRGGGTIEIKVSGSGYGSHHLQDVI